MKTIYTGKVRNAYTKELVSDDGSKKIIIDDDCLEENVMFYRNHFGVIVRIDTGAVYFSRNGAYGYLYDAVKNMGNDCTKLLSCPFIDSASLIPKKITKEEFKSLKKKRSKC